MDFSINLIDEISMVFFWEGSNGILDRIIDRPSLHSSKMYIYMLLLLIAIYFKIPNS